MDYHLSSKPDHSPAAGHRQPVSRLLGRLTADRRLRLSLAIVGAAAVLTGTLSAVALDKPTNRWAAATNAAPMQGPAVMESAGPSSNAPSPLPTERSAASAGPKDSGARSAWPGPGNTGVPPGVKLKPSGEITVTKGGTVLDGLDVHGCIIVKANNVTIKRTRVRGTCDSGSIETPDSTNPANVIIEDVEVDGLNLTTNNPLIAYAGFTCRRCNLHSGGTGIRMGHHVRVEASWIHDSHTGEGSHNAAIAGHGANNFTLLNSRLECLDTEHCSSALSLYNDGAEVYDVLADGNLFSGGGYCVYGGVYDKGPPGHNIRFLRNAFSRTPLPKCGAYGPVVFWSAGPGNVWSGNYWNDPARTPLVIEGGS